ncbi:MAG: transaldolase family protein [Trichodesmium sp.]
MKNNHLLEIENLGQSIWMDNLSRNIIESGELKSMIAQKGIRGITSNPAIFEKAIANAKIAYQEYKKIIQGDRWKALSAKGAKMQRLLWASTSTKNHSYSDVMYVDELIGPDTVNILPPQTIDACADHCHVENRVETNIESANHLIASLKEPDVDINIDQVMDELLAEGINKFIKPFTSLINSLEEKVKKLAPISG